MWEGPARTGTVCTQLCAHDPYAHGCPSRAGGGSSADKQDPHDGMPNGSKCPANGEEGRPPPNLTFKRGGAREEVGAPLRSQVRNWASEAGLHLCRGGRASSFLRWEARLHFHFRSAGDGCTQTGPQPAGGACYNQTRTARLYLNGEVCRPGREAGFYLRW